MKPTIRSGLALLLVVLPFAAEARAQLDLPGRRTPDRARRVRPRRNNQSGTVAPYLVCTVCEERNYTAPIDPTAENGLQPALCTMCQTGTMHKLPEPDALGDLALTRGGATTAEPGASSPPVVEPAAEPQPTDPAAAPPSRGMSAAATFIFDEVGRTRRRDDAVAVHAVDSLLALEDEGRAAARIALNDSHAPTVITAIRVLLIGGDAEDADRVVARLRRRMPSRAATHALEELVRLDPVRATPRLFVELLTHPQVPVRMAAERALEPVLDQSLIPLLVPVLKAEASDSRLRAIHLLSLLDEPTVLEFLLDASDDPKAKVAWRATSAVARSEDPRVELELLRRAFGERWVLRPSAYALLAIIEREDLRLEPILGDQHVPTLLRGLASNDPFVAGSCAAALAGIGFRSADSELSAWLDKEIPATLVATISGQVFFNDYSSLQGPALRRLKLLTGVSFGTDGPRWANWWLAERDHFHASRATLAVAEGAERDLVVQFRSGSDDPVDYVLVGPGRAKESIGDPTSETVFLTESEARDFLELLRREEVLGPTRLPGVRGGMAHRGRTLEVSVGGQSKRFGFGPRASEAWFDRIDEMVRSLVDRNRWQRFPHPVEHGASRYVLWQQESAWWGGDHDERARALRLKQLVLAFLEDVEAGRRSIALVELERLYQDESIPEVIDFPILLLVLASEPFFSGRAARTSTLARHAIGMTDEATAEPSVVLGHELIRVLHDTFGEQAAVEIARVLQASGSDAVLEAAGDQRPLLRAVAATVLATFEEEASRALLLALLEDEDEAVEVAAIMAAGDERVEITRTELLIRARIGTPAVRETALRAIGKLGGESVFPALLTGLTDGDVAIKVASAEGLAALQDPRAIPLLVSLLRQGRDSGYYDPVREGLLTFGDAAWDELLATMRSSSPTAQRESALLLAYQGRPAATSTLIRILTENPDDRMVARELTILTCIDQRQEADPAAMWWDWWDTVRKDDPVSWFFAALEVRNVATPPADVLVPPATEEGTLFLLEVMSREESWLVERARRELTRLVGRDLADIPPDGPERRVWLASLAEVLAQTWE